MGPIILGIIQGLTEFLPVSSSGHLVLLGWVFEIHQDVVIDAFLHLGTLGALIWYFRARIGRLISSLFSRAEPRSEGRWAPYILLGSIPIGLAGLLFQAPIESAFAAPQFAAGMLMVTGLSLLSTGFARPRRSDLEPRDAVLIGLAQAVALLPGISRSGATIATALWLGLDRDLAFDFSFLLSIPAVLGANLLQLPRLSRVEGLPELVAGGLIAFSLGWLSLWLLRDVVRRGRLGWFGVYCLGVGIIGLALL